MYCPLTGCIDRKIGEIENTATIEFLDQSFSDTSSIELREKIIRPCCCKCCNPLKLYGESISTTNGVTTITVKDNSITDICCGRIVKILLPSNTSHSFANVVTVSDGNTIKTIYLCDQYWRGSIKPKRVIVLKNLSDPSLFRFVNIYKINKPR